MTYPNAALGYPPGSNSPVIHIPVFTQMLPRQAVNAPDLYNALGMTESYESWLRRNLHSADENRKWWYCDKTRQGLIRIAVETAIDICDTLHTFLAGEVKGVIRRNADAGKKEYLCDETAETEMAAQDKDTAEGTDSAQRAVITDTVRPKPWSYKNTWPLSSSAVAARFGFTHTDLNNILLQEGLILFTPHVGFRLRYPAADQQLAVSREAHLGSGGTKATLSWTPAGYARICEILADEGFYPIIEEENE